MCCVKLTGPRGDFGEVVLLPVAVEAKVPKGLVETETLATKDAQPTPSETESRKNKNATLIRVVSIQNFIFQNIPKIYNS